MATSICSLIRRTLCCCCSSSSFVCSYKPELRSPCAPRLESNCRNFDSIELIFHSRPWNYKRFVDGGRLCGGKQVQWGESWNNCFLVVNLSVTLLSQQATWSTGKDNNVSQEFIRKRTYRRHCGAAVHSTVTTAYNLNFNCFLGQESGASSLARTASLQSGGLCRQQQRQRH